MCCVTIDLGRPVIITKQNVSHHEKPCINQATGQDVFKYIVSANQSVMRFVLRISFASKDRNELTCGQSSFKNDYW